MSATAHCPDCPVSPVNPSALARLGDDLGTLWRRLAQATPTWAALARASSANPERPLRTTTLDQRTLDDIHAPDWLHRELAARQASERLDELRLRANYPHWL